MSDLSFNSYGSTETNTFVKEHSPGMPSVPSTEVYTIYKSNTSGINEGIRKPFSVGNIVDAVAKVKSAITQKPEGTYGLKDFLQNIDSMGVVIKCRYEITFTGIDNITFFVTNINTPAIAQNFTDVYYEGKKVEIPINYEYNHSFNMTLLCDGEGVIYSTIKNLLMSPEGGSMINSGYTMTVRALGDGDNNDGMQIIMNGVRFRNISGLDFSSFDNSLGTFNLDCSVVDYSVFPGKASVIGTLGSAASEFFSF